MSDENPALDCWAILELLGHVRLAGRVTEETHFGAALGRIDIPGPDGKVVTQYFSGGSIYRLTPTTEDVARAVAAANRPAPVHRWELPAPDDTSEPTRLDDSDDDDNPLLSDPDG